MGPSAPRRVLLVGFDGMELLDIVGPADLFATASRLLGRPAYEVAVATRSGDPVIGSSGLRLDAAMQIAHVRGRLDSFIVGGGLNFATVAGDRALGHQLRRLASLARRSCSVCTGAFLLAEAGLLDGRRATTHWGFCEELARRYPRVEVAPDQIFVRDGHVTTAAGVTAGMDLALALIEEDHGPAVARSVARWSVMFLQRPGGQSQFSERLRLPLGVEPALRVVLDEIVADPGADHRTSELAKRAALSERHLHRVFVAQTQTTPARYVERVRVEAAQDLLEGTASTVEAIASRCGFGSAETMRRAFIRAVGVAPAQYRRRFRSAELVRAA